jgi:4-alpha-glucanotransferase
MFDTGRVSGVLLPVFSLRSRDDFGIGDFGRPRSGSGSCERRPAAVDDASAAPHRAGRREPLRDPERLRSESAVHHLDSVPEYREAGGVSTLSDEERWLLEEARAAHRVKYPSVIRVKWARCGPPSAASRNEGPTPGAASRPTSGRAPSGWRATRCTPPWPRIRSSAPGGSGPAESRERQPQALTAAADRLANRVRFHAWLQFVAQEQWNAVRAVAREQGVLLAGDEPFIIGQDSADTWANPRHLRRDARLGVPPDEFSDTGQDWGLPYFDFEAMEKDDWGWLRLRALHAAQTTTSGGWTTGGLLPQ